MLNSVMTSTAAIVSWRRCRVSEPARGNAIRGGKVRVRLGGVSGEHRADRSFHLGRRLSDIHRGCSDNRPQLAAASRRINAHPLEAHL